MQVFPSSSSSTSSSSSSSSFDIPRLTNTVESFGSFASSSSSVRKEHERYYNPQEEDHHPLLPQPIILHIPLEFLCGICHNLPLYNPVVTPCDHVFCRSCLEDQQLEENGILFCPVDGRTVDLRLVRPLAGWAQRQFWDRLEVGCPHCAWTGTMDGYAFHAATHNPQHHQQPQQPQRQQQGQEQKQQQWNYQNQYQKEDQEFCYQCEEDRLDNSSTSGYPHIQKSQQPQNVHTSTAKNTRTSACANRREICQNPCSTFNTIQKRKSFNATKQQQQQEKQQEKQETIDGDWERIFRKNEQYERRSPKLTTQKRFSSTSPTSACNTFFPSPMTPTRHSRVPLSPVSVDRRGGRRHGGLPPLSPKQKNHTAATGRSHRRHRSFDLRLLNDEDENSRTSRTLSDPMCNNSNINSNSNSNNKASYDIRGDMSHIYLPQL